MNTIQRIVKNAFSLFSALTAVKILTFFTFILLARYLGPEQFGTFAFALAFVRIFSIIMDFGLQPLMVREIARHKELTSKYLSNVTGRMFKSY